MPAVEPGNRFASSLACWASSLPSPPPFPLSFARREPARADPIGRCTLCAPYSKRLKRPHDEMGLFFFKVKVKGMQE